MIKQILLSGVLAASLNLVVAGDAPSAQPPAPAVGEEFQPAVGQGTNRVTARLVEWTDSHGFKRRAYVFLASPSRQFIKASATNQVCLLKGRLISVSINVQSFYVDASLPADQAELTPLLARDVALRQWRPTPAAREIDLRALLKAELANHLAQPMVLRSVKVRSEGETAVVEFVSYTGLTGKVVLDPNLEVVSMSLTGGGGGR